MINIVICCTRKDYYLVKICVASIRFYYPENPIHLIKDERYGKFNTKEIETYWRVSLIEYSTKIFGWAGSKLFFYTDTRFAGKHFLVLDSDIVFAGKLLDRECFQNFNSDILVSPEYEVDPYANWIAGTYFDVKKFESELPSYKYPGYFFNGGQIFCKGGFLKREDLKGYFDFDKYPFFTRLDVLPFVDQSLLNLIFPMLENDKKIKIDKSKFMLWSEGHEVKALSLDKIKEGNEYPYLIHWAGAKRNPYLNKMTRSDILQYFTSYYYKKIPYGNIKKKYENIKAVTNFYLNELFQLLIKGFKKISGIKKFH